VTALVQAWVRPPLVRELGRVLEDAMTASGFWRNRVLRILLVFVLTSLGTIVGSWVGGVRIFANLFSG
jgi:pheromone shutdown protein TraB